MLRKAGEVATETTKRVTLSDLVNGGATSTQDTRLSTVSVRRATKQEDYSVPTEDGDALVVTTGRGRAVPKR
jgi:hypothetical protein